MISTLQLAIDFRNKLQKNTSELTEGYGDYYHLMNIDGFWASAATSFETLKLKALRNARPYEIYCDQMNANSVATRSPAKDQYYNMRQVIEDVTPIAKSHGRSWNTPIIEPTAVVWTAISFMGTPTPNICRWLMHECFECKVSNHGTQSWFIIGIVTVTKLDYTSKLQISLRMQPAVRKC